MSASILLAFVRTHWRSLAVLAAALAAFLWVRHLEHAAYARGKADAVEETRKLVAAENARNRAVEQNLLIEIGQFADKVKEQQRQLVERETVYRDRVVTLTNNDPSQKCATNPQVTDARNQIRGSLK